MIVYTAQATRDAAVGTARAAVPLAVTAARATGTGIVAAGRRTVVAARFVASLVPARREPEPPAEIPRAIPQAHPVPNPAGPQQPISIVINNSPSVSTNVVQANTNAAIAGSRELSSNGLATFALILAAASVIASFIPDYATWAFLLSPAAFLFAGLGFLVSLFRGLAGLGAALLAALLAFVALPVAAARVASQPPPAIPSAQSEIEP